MAERKWRSDCDVETIRSDGEIVIGVAPEASLSIRLRTAVAVARESFLHPLSRSLITLQIQQNRIDIMREPNC